MRVLVVGGTGLIGGDAALLLAAQGHKVAVATRHPPPPDTGMAALEFLPCDYLAGGLPADTLLSAGGAAPRSDDPVRALAQAG